MTTVRADMPDDIERFVRAHIGPLAHAVFCGWYHGVSDVWECRAADGRHVFVKSCRDKYDQEAHAYQAWVSHLDDRCPQLIAADADLGILVLTAVDGTLAQEMDLDADVFHQAGCVLRDLHGLALGGAQADPVAAFVERAERWDRRSAAFVDDDDRAWMSGRIREITELLPHVRRVPCHRDYTPRNWVIDAEGRLRVIDFGHARADYWILDVDKLWSDQWIDRSDREAAFWDGYGTRPTDDERNVLGAVSALGAVSTITWSREHGDSAYEAHGRAHLARLRERGR
jgi:Ser/Thr protein kinase RdoA (MazF antagonist)